jgi:hypothetical protein
MGYKTRTHFAEHDDGRTDGFTIINHENGRYHLAEKIEFGEGERWTQYWVAESDLDARVEDDACEPVGKVTERQLKEIKKAVGLYQISPEEAHERAKQIAAGD